MLARIIELDQFNLEEEILGTMPMVQFQKQLLQIIAQQNTAMQQQIVALFKLSNKRKQWLKKKGGNGNKEERRREMLVEVTRLPIFSKKKE